MSFRLNTKEAKLNETVGSDRFSRFDALPYGLPFVSLQSFFHGSFKKFRVKLGVCFHTQA